MTVEYQDALGRYHLPPLNILPFHPIEDALSEFPVDETGVYIVTTDCSTTILYIGMTGNFADRLSHVRSKHHKLGPIVEEYPDAKIHLLLYPWWLHQTDKVDSAQWVMELQQLLRGFESACIAHYRPRLNDRR